MYLEKLVINNAINNEVIEEINFNEHGISPIVDETNDSESEVLTYKNLNKEHNNATKVLLKKNNVQNIQQLEKSIELLEDEYKNLKEKCPDLNVVEEYEENFKEYNQIGYDILNLENEISTLNFRLEQIDKSIENTEKRNFEFDTRYLKEIYEDVKLNNLNKEIKEFEEYITFHNGMLYKRIESLNKRKVDTKEQLNKVEKDIKILRKEYENKYTRFQFTVSDKYRKIYYNIEKKNEELIAKKKDLEYIKKLNNDSIRTISRK